MFLIYQRRPTSFFLLYKVHCKMYFILCKVHCKMYCMLCKVHCNMYCTVCCTKYIVECIVCCAFSFTVGSSTATKYKLPDLKSEKLWCHKIVQSFFICFWGPKKDITKPPSSGIIHIIYCIYNSLGNPEAQRT